MALWRVLDIYKRGAELRGQAPAKTTHFNSDKKVNSKPSGSGRSPLNRFANRPVKPQSAFFEFCSFLLTEFFSFPIVSGGVFLTSFFLFSHITNCFFVTRASLFSFLISGILSIQISLAKTFLYVMS